MRLLDRTGVDRTGVERIGVERIGVERSSKRGAMSGTCRRVARVLVLCAVVAPGARAIANDDASSPTYRRNRGAIVFQSEPFGSFEDEDGFAKLVAQAKKNRALSSTRPGQWTFHFIAFLKQAPGADKINLVWYRATGKHEQVDFTEFTVPPQGVLLQAQNALSEPMGFKPGDRLEARVTRLINGREVVYARTPVTLK